MKKLHGTPPIGVLEVENYPYFEAPKQGVLRVVLNFEDFVRGSPMEIFILDSSFGRLLMSIERILKRLFNLGCMWVRHTFQFMIPHFNS